MAEKTPTAMAESMSVKRTLESRTRTATGLETVSSRIMDPTLSTLRICRKTWKTRMVMALLMQSKTQTKTAVSMQVRQTQRCLIPMVMGSTMDESASWALIPDPPIPTATASRTRSRLRAKLIR